MYIVIKAIPIIIVTLATVFLFLLYKILKGIKTLFVFAGWRLFFYHYRFVYKLNIFLGKCLHFLIKKTLQIKTWVLDKLYHKGHVIAPIWYILDTNDLKEIDNYIAQNNPDTAILTQAITVNSTHYPDNLMPLFGVSEPFLKNIQKLLQSQNTVYAHNPAILLNDCRKFPPDIQELNSTIITKLSKSGTLDSLSKTETQFLNFFYGQAGSTFKIEDLAQNLYFWEKLGRSSSTSGSALSNEFYPKALPLINNAMEKIVRYDGGSQSQQITDCLQKLKQDLLDELTTQLTTIINYNQLIIYQDPRILQGVKIRELGEQALRHNPTCDPLQEGANIWHRLLGKTFPWTDAHDHYRGALYTAKRWHPRPSLKNVPSILEDWKMPYELPSHIDSIMCGASDIPFSFSEIAWKLITLTF